ncbi:class I SAM-dependent methyltransferase [Solidesulfovibrio sp.]
MTAAKDRLEASVRDCYATWSESYYRDYYGEGAAYPPVHRDIFKNLLAKAGAGNILDAGCGPASLLRELLGTGLDLYGFDLTPQMVVEGRKVLAEAGLPSGRLWEGSVRDPDAYRDPEGRLTGRFDAAICSGVFPHLPEEADAEVAACLREAVRPGGLVAVEARNALFSLFTLNRYSHAFFLHELIRADELQAGLDAEQRETLQKALAGLEDRFRMDLPPVRRGGEGSPGYDEILSRTHNPFILRAVFEDLGLVNVRLLFYHFHCLPPMLETGLGELFRHQSLAMEQPTDWRGHFMASAFIIVGEKP